MNVYELNMWLEVGGKFLVIGIVGIVILAIICATISDWKK